MDDSRRGRRGADRCQLDRMERMLGAILRRVTRVLRLEERQMAVLDDLETEVRETGTVVDSAAALLTGLNQALKDAIASGDPARVKALSDQLDASNTRLAEAIVTNTPQP